jgi:hypothetical protein
MEKMASVVEAELANLDRPGQTAHGGGPFQQGNASTLRLEGARAHEPGYAAAENEELGVGATHRGLAQSCRRITTVRSKIDQNLRFRKGSLGPGDN